MGAQNREDDLKGGSGQWDSFRLAEQDRTSG